MQIRAEHIRKLMFRKDEYSASDRIECADGTTLSVQGGSTAYCEPRENNAHWTSVEVGFPSKKLIEIMEYAEEPDNPTSSVYGYVPIELVVQAINSCGGINAEDLI
jgi:hypothetical protein